MLTFLFARRCHLRHAHHCHTFFLKISLSLARSIYFEHDGSSRLRIDTAIDCDASGYAAFRLAVWALIAV